MSANAPGAKKGSLGPALGSVGTLFERRWLIWYFVQRQLARSYRGSFLGLAWLVLGPLFMVALYTLVFSEIIGLRFREAEGGVSNFGLYVYCGLIPFLAYSDTVNQAVGSIRKNSSLVQKVVFPLEILPMSTALTAFVTQFFGLGALLFLVLIFEHQLQWTLLLLPLVVLPQLIFMLGLSYLGAVVGTYLPDVQETLRAIVRATFFVTPIIWDADRIPADSDLRFLIDYNPLAYLVDSYRAVVLEGRLPDMTTTFWFTLFSTVLLVFGFLLFTRVKQRFADLI